MTDVEMRETWINDRWPLMLPVHRHLRDSWSWWEAGRLASMWHHLGQPYSYRNTGHVVGETRFEYPWQPVAHIEFNKDPVVDWRNGEVVYDIGSEEGDFPALFSSWGCDVVLFEPNDRVWPNIKAIWDANELRPPLATFLGFAGPEDHFKGIGVERFPVCAEGEVIGDHGFKTMPEYPEIPVITIDTMAEAVKPPTAITIDCEGAELQVLRGARQTLLERRPKCWVSVHPDFMRDMYRDEPADLFAFMDELGYERTHICFDHESHEMFLPR